MTTSVVVGAPSLTRDAPTSIVHVMSGQIPNPIAAEAARKALGQATPADATERVALDAAELRDLEQELYQDGSSGKPDTDPTGSSTGPPPRRGILDRLFRRHPSA
jgi:hypothetical protein